MSFLAREAAHVEGFAPELAVVTSGGGKELEEPLAVRPTSETVVNHMFAQWIKSRRDLPLMLNQWCNVVRWEMRTRPFVRTTEFLWQEGHTAHASAGEATRTAVDFVELYARFAREVAAIPVIAGRKSRAESFAGADTTFTIEAMMGDGRALQAGTSHDLGSNFAKAFGTRFAGGEDGTADESGLSFVHQSSWGVSTRMVGGVIMAHGDDGGARLPPALAPVQVIIIPIFKKGADSEAVVGAANALAAACASIGVRAKVDAEADKTPGWKYAHWEVKGVPLRLEVGPRDLASQTAVMVRRDTGVKEVVAWADLAARTPALLKEIQADMLASKQAEFDACLEKTTDWAGFMAALDRKHMVLAPWADEEAVEKDVRTRSASGDSMGAKTLCIPFDQPPLPEGMVCFASGKPAKNWALWGRSY